MPLDTKELTPEFLADTEAMLNQFDQNLIALENSPQDEELLTGSRRIVHTVHGTAGFLGFKGLSEIAKAGEQLLAFVCEGGAELSREQLSFLRDTSEVLRGWTKRIAAGSFSPCARQVGLLSELIRLTQSHR